MITWAQACEEVGYTNRVRESRPKLIPVYYAYKNGTVKTFDSNDHAKLYSNTVESSYTEESQLAHDNFKDKIISLERQASEHWANALRKEHSELNDKVYNLCHAMAYECGHASGRDDIASYMEDLVILANAIIADTKSNI